MSVSREEFDEVIDDLYRTVGEEVIAAETRHQEVRRRLVRMERRVTRMERTLWAVARHLGIDPNGDTP